MICSRVSVITSAEIISVGTELLLGEIIDTNSSYLAQSLADRGVDVYWSQRVGDNLGRIQHLLSEALSRSDLIILSGGLGPTDDDLTREAIAATLGETPAVDAALERDLRAKFARFSREMPEKNLKQAWLIPAAASLPNPIGTAPGWLVTTHRAGKVRYIVTLPGPPRELQRMWTEEAAPRLPLPEAALFVRMYKTFGMGESALAEKLGALTDAANPSVATYAKTDGVHVRVAAKAQTLREAKAIAEPVLKSIEAQFKEIIWGTDRDELAVLVHEQLTAKGLTLATLELASGGLLAERLSAVTATSRSYLGGMVACTMQQAVALGVDSGRQASEDPDATVRALAAAVNNYFNADIGVVIAGMATTDDKGSADVPIAIVGQKMSKVQHLKLPLLDRQWLRERCTYAALFQVWSLLRAS
jgi:nicotinamide-nucleotide amidase